MLKQVKATTGDKMSVIQKEKDGKGKIATRSTTKSM